MSKTSKFIRSQNNHHILMTRYHRKSNTPENRAFGNYHADCIDNQKRLGRVLKYSEKKSLWKWWWDYEVLDKRRRAHPILK